MADWKAPTCQCLQTCLNGAIAATPTRTTSLEVKFICQPIRFTEELELAMREALIFLMRYQSESTLSGFPMLSGLGMNLTQSSPSATHNHSSANASLILPVPQLNQHQSEGFPKVAKQTAKIQVDISCQPACKKTLF